MLRVLADIIINMKHTYLFPVPLGEQGNWHGECN